MRLKSPIISFFLTLTIGVALVQWQSFVDWLWPSFGKDEVVAKVGRRVRYRHTDKFRGMKCPLDGICREIQDAEMGTIIGIEQVPDRGYFLTVAWDEPGGSDRYVSYFGRFTRRESLIEE